MRDGWRWRDGGRHWRSVRGAKGAIKGIISLPRPVDTLTQVYVQVCPQRRPSASAKTTIAGQSQSCIVRQVCVRGNDEMDNTFVCHRLNTKVLCPTGRKGIRVE
jgi:hypothetical protein